MTKEPGLNVLGGPLQSCSKDPITGFYRTGGCEVGPDDTGVHAVCIRATKEFLDFSKARGNDLSTPRPQWGFSGVKPGDQWCLCADRWKEALDSGMAPPVVLEATHQATLRHVSLNDLLFHALTSPTA